jgi:hypothetical protein
MGGWVKRIKKEIKKHPAKAVLLGVLCLVALILWGPKMARRQSPREDGKTLAASGTMVLLPASIASEMGQSGKNGESDSSLGVKEKWKEIARWHDAHRGELAIADDFRDPLAAVATGDGGAQNSAREAAQDMGAVARSMIRCTGVIITPRRRWVVLDGKCLEEGSELMLRQGSVECRLQVVRVHENKVVFKVNDTLFEYNIKNLGITTNR